MITPDVANELERFRRGVCGGCEAQGRCWLGLERSVDDTGTAHGKVTYTTAHQGGTGVVHGGWLMATFDEVCGLIPTTAGLMGATASMEVRFRRPVPIGVPLEITARQTSASAESRVIEGRMTPAGGEEVLADCVATFVDLTTDKALRRDRRVRHLRNQQAPGSQAAPGRLPAVQGGSDQGARRPHHRGTRHQRRQARMKLAVITESIQHRYVSGKELDSLSSGLGDAAPALLQMGLMVAAEDGLAGLAA